MPVRVFTQEEKDELRIKMLDAGFPLLKEYGMTHTSISKITKAASIGVSTFYNFWKTKEEYMTDLIHYHRTKMLPLILDKVNCTKSRQIVYKNAEFLNLIDILKKYPYEISGGEKQRTAIARAMVNDPQIIFGDEPTGNLDSAMTASIMDYLESINRVKGKAMVIVTHDSMVASYCKQVVFIKDGKTEKIIENKGDRDARIRRITDIMMRL